ncbi:hypothetical protein LTR17_024429 [Elasticomyces elasticus]|nr:hypothetical protein LTR17_024429 [Elasticomyces elasticus]
MASKELNVIARAETRFRLLSLPPELWSRTCRLAVTRQDPMQFSEDMSCREVKNIVKQPAITLVCKIIREEIIDDFYGNLFVFKDHLQTENLFWSWLRALCVGDRVKYSIPSLKVRSQFDLMLACADNVFCKRLGGNGLCLQRIGENEFDLASCQTWAVYKVVPTPASR